MRIIDYTPAVRALVISVLEIIGRFERRVLDPEFDPKVLVGDGSADVLAGIRDLYQLRRVAGLDAPALPDPARFLMEFDGSETPDILSTVEGKETWDFRPWLSQKVRGAEEEFFAICEFCSPRQPEAFQGRWPGFGADQDIRGSGERALEHARLVLEDVVGLIESGELKIQRLSVDELSE